MFTACATTPTGEGPDPGDIERVTVIAPYLTPTNAVTPGATVLFYDVSGTLLDRETTGADGHARSIAGPVASVVVVPPTAAGADFYAWTDVWPGDHLYTQRDAAHAAATAPGHHVAVTIPRFGNDATSYSVSAVGMATVMNAGSGADPLTLDATIDAAAPTVGDVVAQVATGAASHFIVAHGVALDSSAVDLRASHWANGAPFSATIALPAGADWLTAYDQRLVAGSVLWQDSVQADAPTTDVALTFMTPPAGDGAGLAVSYQLADGTTYALSYNEPPDGLDTAQLMPLATDVLPTVDHAVTWNASATAPAEIGVEMTTFSPVGAWHVVMPPGQRSFVLPTVPADLPAPPMQNARVTFVVGNEPGAYGALRTDLDVFDLPRWAETMPRIRGTYRFAGR